MKSKQDGSTARKLRPLLTGGEQWLSGSVVPRMAISELERGGPHEARSCEIRLPSTVVIERRRRCRASRPCGVPSGLPIRSSRRSTPSSCPLSTRKRRAIRSAVLDNEIRRREAAEKRARLIRELYKVAPDHKRIPALMEERWKTLGVRTSKRAGTMS